MNEPILTIKEAAEYLKISPSTTYKLILTEDLPAIRIGKNWRIRRARLEEWMNNKECCSDIYNKNTALILEL